MFAEPQLSPAEEEAEQLMRQAAVAWNVQHNKEAAERFQRKALEVVTKEVCFCWIWPVCSMKTVTIYSDRHLVWLNSPDNSTVSIQSAVIVDL